MRGWHIALGAALGTSIVTAAAAQEETRNFSIPAQSLAGALDAFGRQSAVDLFYSDDAVRGRRSPGVSGPMTPQAALAKLLAGTGFVPVFTARNAATVRPAQVSPNESALPAAPAPSGSGPVGPGAAILPPISVTGEAWRADGGSFNARNATTAAKTDTFVDMAKPDGGHRIADMPSREQPSESPALGTREAQNRGGA
jgi:iron complex outermembrane recepter protein